MAGDRRTPKNWFVPNVQYLSIKEQDRRFQALSRKVARNHYARKNIAYAHAIALGATSIYESDDDNIPYRFFPTFLEGPSSLQCIQAPPTFNTYSLFTKKRVWPRGLAMTHHATPIQRISKKRITPLIQHSLVDSDPDVDAIYRLTSGAKIRFDRNKVFGFSKGTYCPVNSQNTYWDKKVFKLLYLPSTVSMRTTDIWRGYIAQRILWKLGGNLVLLSPGVYQERNPHNLLRDFQEEIDVYLRTEELLSVLQSSTVTGDIDDMLIGIYKELIRKKFFHTDELGILREWLRIFTR